MSWYLKTIFLVFVCIDRSITFFLPFQEFSRLRIQLRLLDCGGCARTGQLWITTSLVVQFASTTGKELWRRQRSRRDWYTSLSLLSNNENGKQYFSENRRLKVNWWMKFYQFNKYNLKMLREKLQYWYVL